MDSVDTFPMDPVSLMVACVVSSIGLSLFVYGKKQARIPQLLAGSGLMALPMCTLEVGGMLGGTAVLLIGTRWAVARGW